MKPTNNDDGLLIDEYEYQYYREQIEKKFVNYWRLYDYTPETKERILDLATWTEKRRAKWSAQKFHQ
jgi:hypothetical protein